MQFFLNGAATTLSDADQDDLARAVINSIFTWARADVDDDLPGKSLEGWWGDSFPDSQGDAFGSKLWLLQRAKLTDETVAKAKDYVEECLKWMLSDGVAGSVEVEAQRGDFDRLDILVVVTKPDATQMTMRFQDVWER